MLGPFATASRLAPIHQMSLAVLSRAACASMSTTTTTTRDRGDRCGPMEWAQSTLILRSHTHTNLYLDKHFTDGYASHRPTRRNLMRRVCLRREHDNYYSERIQTLAD